MGPTCLNRHQLPEERIEAETENREGSQQDGDLIRQDTQPPTTEDERGTSPRRYWQTMSTIDAETVTENIYRKIVAFSPNNICEIPKCNATKELIKEIEFLIREYTNGTYLQPIALKIVAIIPHLICQKTHDKSKTTENVKAIKRRMERWKEGDIHGLLEEAVALQNRHNKSKAKKNEADKCRKFANLMQQGKVTKAVRFLTSDLSAGTLPLDENTRRMLNEKHPPAKEAVPETMFQGVYHPPPPEIFECITGEKIWRHALHTSGAAGPSGLDADGWKCILSTSKFGNTANDLCKAIAALARKLATENCQHIDALIACRLIALDKKPGCRPIGIGEVLRRIIGKAIMEVVGDDVKTAVGNLQVCVGQRAGCEAAIHAMRGIFEEPECEAVLMVDAANAFNNINRQATLHNIGVKCPSFAQYIKNTYSEPAKLYIVDRQTNTCEVISSAEGTTQGDPVAMAMYAIGLLKLQDHIKCNTTKVKQVAYADDLTGAGKISDLRKWWDIINTRGPPQGYYPNAIKSVLIVKPELVEQAKEIFRNSDIKITAGGEKHLGAVLGTTAAKEEFVRNQVNEWVNEIKTLAHIAETEPHSAYTAFTFGIKHKWNFLMRTVSNIEHLFEPLEEIIKKELLPALSGRRNPTAIERTILELPPRLGGLGMTNPSRMANTEFENSIKLTASLTQSIIAQDTHTQTDMREQIRIRKELTNARENLQKTALQEILTILSEQMKRKIEMAREIGASNWLTTLPIKTKGFSLNKQEFVDAIALRYGWSIDGLHQHCTCGSSFDPNHAMTCKTGGFVCMRHDEVRDVTAQMLGEVCRDVRIEPALIPTGERNFSLRSTNTADDARQDVSASGFWVRGQRAFFDIRIFNPMSSSNCTQELKSAHTKHENQKMREYGERIREVEQGTFTPLVFTTSGGMAPRAITFYSCLAQQLAERRKQQKSCVVAWIRCRLAFSLLRSALLCLRGTRTKPTTYTSVRDIDIEQTVIDSRIDINM